MALTPYRFAPIVPLLIAAMLHGMFATNAQAADVHAQLSTRESYVGESIVLQIVIKDASDFSAPTIPSIDGLEIRSQGVPQRQRQLTSINGRVSETNSTILSYSVTPSRAGEFEIPPLAITVDAKKLSTPALPFVAVVSETGDLMFVEIEGKQDRVYVGQPLELSLKIWLRPFRDRERQITLDSASLWSTVSPRSSWGSFAGRLSELANARKHPPVREVLRVDQEGNSRSYYLYEIETTIYPKRPGRIDASGVKVVVDYPVRLGRPRDPMSDFFGGSLLSPFGTDDRFGSLFGAQLQITKSRPIEAEAKVDATQVIPIPTQGRPDSYRGAVGNYTITARTDTLLTHAGDPVTLQIAIQGDGSLELVQAPPLDALHEGFRVDQQPLAGFVQDGAKYFTTTVRPRDTSVTEIPPIEMSFFDPQTETFQTVATQPIPLQVRESETLQLDSIAANVPADMTVADRSEAENPLVGRFSLTTWLFQNRSDENVLQMQTGQSLLPVSLCLAFGPPLMFVVVWLLVHRDRLMSPSRLFRSGKQRVLADLRGSASSDEIASILLDYLNGLRRGEDSDDPLAWQNGLGFLRARGQSAMAAELETLAHNCKTKSISHPAAVQHAKDWIERIESIRKSGWRGNIARQGAAAMSTSVSAAAGHRIAFFAAMLLFSNGSLWAIERAGDAAMSGMPAANPLSLDASQRAALLTQAGQIYAEGLNAEGLNAEVLRSGTDPERGLFELAAEKYQQIIDSGIRSAGLFLNLGNARYHGGELGRAIASYRRAQRLAPLSLSAQVNLLLVQISAGVPVSQYRLPLVWLVVLGAGSILGWTLLAAHIVVRRRAIARLGFTFLLMAVCGAAMLVREEMFFPQHQAIVVVDQLQLQSGDGEGFATLATMPGVQGQAFEYAVTRSQWVQLVEHGEPLGWVPRHHLELLEP